MKTTNAEAAYLFDLIPSLGIAHSPTNNITLSWPLLSPEFTLQQNTNGTVTANWSNVTETVQDNGTNKYIIIEPATGNRFFRLSKP